ncbi:MAG: TetR/AcrR family transcriptional regulator [Eubacteriales bacterium]
MEEKSVRIPNQKRSIEKKEKIIMAAYEIFNIKGYFETNTAEIAVAAGVSTGSVYAYFKDKKDILLICLEMFGEELTQKICSAIAQTVESDTGNAAKNVLRIFVESHFAKRIFHDEVMSLLYRDEDVKIAFMQMERSMMSAIARELAKIGLDFTHEREQTYLLFTLVKGIEEQLAFEESSDIDKNILIEESARIMSAMFKYHKN